MQTVIHVTHEAIQKIGGIGAVLEGLLTSREYLQAVPRNILVGPFWHSDAQGEQRLGPDGEVLYSSLDRIFRTPLTGALREVEQDFGVGLIYGRRKYSCKETGVSSSAEVVLIDVSRMDGRRLGIFKYDLWKTFGIDSGRYEQSWDYEQYTRLAQPAIAALHALGVCSEVEPAVIFSHEYMGMPTVLAALMDPMHAQFRTIFYAHEVATMRRLVEGHPGHDTMFYNVMRAAMAAGHCVEEVFGDQSAYYRHTLVKAARHCDGIFAVGDYVQKEMKFLAPEFVHVDSQLAYNGVPHWRIDVQEKMASRNKLQQYCQNLFKFRPDYVFTHVARLVPSKGMWRDLRVLEHMEPMLQERGETAVLITLSTEVPQRRTEDVMQMERRYHWPAVHREPLPDLSNGEALYYEGVQEFNACSRNIKVLFVNQFGFEQRLCGMRMPADMEFMDIRKGSDAEFGQAIYEPFGISPVEPISFGGICVYTNVCGCAGFVAKAAGGDGQTPNAIVADYTELPDRSVRPDELMSIGQAQRDAIEHRVAEQVARELFNRLPRTPAEFEAYLERGHALAEKMSWDAVARDYVIPGLQRAIKAHRLRQIA